MLMNDVEELTQLLLLEVDCGLLVPTSIPV